MSNYLLSLSFIISFFFCSCKKEYQPILPDSTGKYDEIVVIMDSSDWQSDLGSALRVHLTENIAGLPQNEPCFILRRVSFDAFWKYFRNYRNLLFIRDRSSQGNDARKISRFFNDSLTRIKKDTLNWFISKKKFAKNQNIVYLTDLNSEFFIEKLLNQGNIIKDFFLKKEMENRVNKLKEFAQTSINLQKVVAKYDFKISLPEKYLLVMDTVNFLWFREIKGIKDKNIFLSIRKYESEEQFSKQYISVWREEIAKKWIYGSNSTQSFMTRQELYPLEYKTLNLNEKMAVETKSVWKLNNNTMGGPYVSLTFTDNSNKRIIYAEGFLYSPDEPKREPIRELEAILRTIQF